MNIQGKDSIDVINGIGTKKAELLGKLGIHTVDDMITYYPRTYEDRRTVTASKDVSDNDTVLLRGKVSSSRLMRISRRKSMVLVTAEDGTGMFRAVFFNAPYLAKNFMPGQEYEFYGRAKVEKGIVKLNHPGVTKAEEAVRGIIPIYPVTKGLTNREMIRIQRILKEYALSIEDMLDEDIRMRNNVCGISYALANIHFPESGQKLNESKYRLVFDEFLVIQLGLGMMKSTCSRKTGGTVFSPEVDENEYISSLGFEFTGAQKRVVKEIMADMESPRIMNRLLQGDVGSGKTAVAETALFKAVKSGYQGVLMAPTEVLAKQHFHDLKTHFAPFGINVMCLSSSLKKPERTEVLKHLADGTCNVLIGTHAVIQPDVKFENLGLVITDEQHRFGVEQRMLLTKKGTRPDRLVMTATPIPRTLTVTMFGDMEVSKIDELPAGRKPIQTMNYDDSTRDEAYNILKAELEKGHQAYIVTPLIDDESGMDIRSVYEVYDEAGERLENRKVAMLHGEMKSSEKEEIMSAFARGEIDVLVSTVVIEVGINVPNATVMLIENAERFGLAQLHQLRGRVGRGKALSYCLLVTCSDTEKAKERAEIICSTTDGFVIAEEDLKLRGPGEVFGVRQHGELKFKIGDIFKHHRVMEKAAAEAKLLLKEDPYLEKEEHRLLKEKVSALYGEDMMIEL